MFELLFPLVAIILYGYGIFFASPSSQTWLIFDVVVQGLGLLYALHCYMGKNTKCRPEALALLFCALGIAIGYRNKLATGDPVWAFLDGSTVAVWATILFHHVLK